MSVIKHVFNSVKAYCMKWNTCLTLQTWPRTHGWEAQSAKWTSVNSFSRHYLSTHRECCSQTSSEEFLCAADDGWCRDVQLVKQNNVSIDCWATNGTSTPPTPSLQGQQLVVEEGATVFWTGQGYSTYELRATVLVYISPAQDQASKYLWHKKESWTPIWGPVDKSWPLRDGHIQE